MLWLILFVAVLLLFLVALILFLVIRSTISTNCQREGCRDGQICSRGGECIPEGTCLVNGDCPSGLCVSKTCTPETPIIQTCKESGDCDLAGYRCEEVEGRKICTNKCQNDLDCLGSQACLEGVCFPKPCLSSIDCPGGESCINTLDSQGKSGNFCSGGQPCEKFCPYPLTCLGGECRECNSENKELCGNHVCRKESCLPCSKEVPCPENRECFFGACCPKKGFGESCMTNEDCSSSNSYCVKEEGERGICACTLLPRGARCFDSLSCLNISCRALGGDASNRRCSTLSCLVNEDCPESTPYCGGECTLQLLGTVCPAGEESLCTEKGYHCPSGVCRKEPPGYGERCLEECKEGLVCKEEISTNSTYKYCKV